MLMQSESETGGRNHPRAFRMGVIAFLNQGISIACVWGSFSVLLLAVSTRLGVSRELSALAVPAVNLASSALAPVAGALAARYSLRLIMLTGALLGAAGFLLLAFSTNYILYLAAYGLLLGPGMSVGSVLPATLVTRWYAANRGRALGFVNAPVVIVLVPFASTWALQRYGIQATYLMLAGLSLLTIIVNVFIIDHPPGAAILPSPHAGDATGKIEPPSLSIAQLLRMPKFWAVAICYPAASAGLVFLAALLVPLARSWGFSATLAASLLSIQCAAAVAGTILFGWLADRLGSARTLAVLLLDGTILWLLLPLHPPFILTAIIIGLIGAHSVGALPAVGVALSEYFGQQNFSKAFGLVVLINLPFSVLAVPAVSLVFERTGSYDGAIIGEAGFLILASAMIFAVARHGAAHAGWDDKAKRMALR
jgi:MFS family permease